MREYTLSNIAKMVVSVNVPLRDKKEFEYAQLSAAKLWPSVPLVI